MLISAQGGFAFRGRAGEPPDMNETVKALLLSPGFGLFLTNFKKRSYFRFFAYLVRLQPLLARVTPSLAY